jgi:prepilin signal peptidase PulO-like enzyme (type II secretory pathway)
MALTLKCRVCGAVIPGRYPVYLLTWFLAIATVFLLLIIPTLIGFATVVGGAAVIVGVFVAILAVYLYVRTADSCQACQMSERQSNR